MKATTNVALLVGRFGRSGTEVRLAKSGDHWPGYDETITLRAGYWVGNHRRHDWVGTRKKDVLAEVMARAAIHPETGEADVEWL